MVSFETFKTRAEELLKEIAAICHECGRDPKTVRLLPVTKTHPSEIAEYVLRFGLPAVGENRVQEAIEKKAHVNPQLQWELIGHLQSNKAKLAARHFARVQTVESEKLASALDRAAEEEKRILPVLLQVNAGNDPAKFGVDPADSPTLLTALLALRHLRVEGLMTIAPLSSDPAVSARTFANLRELRDRLETQFGVRLPELSMGMSGDFAAAIQAGSTQVRVGSRLFGERLAQSL